MVRILLDLWWNEHSKVIHYENEESKYIENTFQIFKERNFIIFRQYTIILSFTIMQMRLWNIIITFFF